MKIQSFALATLSGAVVALCACSSSTLPSAASLTANSAILREQAAPEFAALDRQRAAGTLSEEEYRASKDAIDRRINVAARDSAWSRHSLAQSERKALGLPTPDQPIFEPPPNAMMGGPGGGTLYRPFTMQSAGAGGAMPAFNGNILPNFGNMNNSGSMYMQPPEQ